MGHRIDVVRGTLELLILKTLSAGHPRHGFGVLHWIRDVTQGQLVIEEAALYPALHRMEDRGWIRGEWEISEKGRRARYYTMTADGRKQLRLQESAWLRYIDAWQRIALAASPA